MTFFWVLIKQNPNIWDVAKTPCGQSAGFFPPLEMGDRPPKPSTGLGVNPPKKSAPGVSGVNPQKSPGRLGVGAGLSAVERNPSLPFLNLSIGGVHD
jgi:hypothetical protein